MWQVWFVASGCLGARAFTARPPTSRRLYQLSSLSEEAARSEILRRNDAVDATRFQEAASSGDERAIAVEAETSFELSTLGLVAERALQAGEDWLGPTTQTPPQPVRGRRIVILGSGWGAGSLVKSLGTVGVLHQDVADANFHAGGDALFDSVTVISPRNYFL